MCTSIHPDGMGGDDGEEAWDRGAEAGAGVGCCGCGEVLDLVREDCGVGCFSVASGFVSAL